MKILAEKLRDIRDRALQLKSLKPGEGYDELGFALCNVVAETKMDFAEREQFFAYLDNEYPGLLQDLQNISIQSEIELDRFHAHKILKRMKDIKVREHILSLPVADRLSEILHDYPHGWIYARTKEVVGLLNIVSGQDLADCQKTYFIIGRSNLPLDALGFHLTTGCPVIWYDPYEDSRAIAADFIHEMEYFGLLKAGSIEVQDLNLKNKYPFDKNGLAAIILDDDLMKGDLFEKLNEISLPMITVDPVGIAKLLYPYSVHLRPSKDLYTQQAVILAKNAYDEPVEALSWTASSTQMFLSLTLYI